MPWSNSRTPCPWRNEPGYWTRNSTPGELADEYVLVRSQECQSQAKRQPTKKWCSYCKTPGREKGECRKLRAKQERDAPSGGTNKESSGRDQGKKVSFQCFNCKKKGQQNAPVRLIYFVIHTQLQVPDTRVWRLGEGMARWKGRRCPKLFWTQGAREPWCTRSLCHPRKS